MVKMIIIVERSSSPLHKYLAYTDTYDGPESPVGTGNTIADAVEFLLDQIGDTYD